MISPVNDCTHTPQIPRVHQYVVPTKQSQLPIRPVAPSMMTMSSSAAKSSQIKFRLSGILGHDRGTMSPRMAQLLTTSWYSRFAIVLQVICKRKTLGHV